MRPESCAIAGVALSGYGTISACAVAELSAARMTGSILPDDSAVFSPDRYAGDALMDEIEKIGL